MQKSSSKQELFKPGLSNYALGWRIDESNPQCVVQSHGGSVRGFVCEIRRYPIQDACLFVLCNRDDVYVDSIALALQEIMFNEPPTISQPPKSLDAALAKALVGQYDDEQGRQFFVETDGNVTRARIVWSGPQGPVTNGVLGRGQGGVVLYCWSEVHPVKIQRQGDEPVQSLGLLKGRYRRVP